MQELLHIKESRLEWITQQISVIHLEYTTVHSVREALLPHHLTNAKIVQPDENLLTNAKPTVQRYQRHFNNNKSRSISRAILSPIHSSKISKSKKKGPTPLHQQINITKSNASRQQITKTETKLLSAVNIVPRSSKRIAERKKKLDTLKSSVILDSNMNVSSPPTNVTPCRSKQLYKNKGSNSILSGSMTRPDNQKRITRSKSKR